MKKFIKALLAVILFIIAEIYALFAAMVSYQNPKIHIWIFPDWITVSLIVLASGVMIYFIGLLVNRLLESIFEKKE